MLNYLGAQPGPGLSMPAGMPGSGSPTDPMLSPAAAAGASMGGGGMPPQGAPPPAAMPPAPQGGVPMPGQPAGGPGMSDAAGRQYMTETQQDGSILLYLKNPDGSKGPAVKIITPPKAGKPPTATQ